MKTHASFLVAALLTACAAQAQNTATLAIDAGKPGIPISPTLYGLMTEEINHSYDGGLYAELIRNRTFKIDPGAGLHWKLDQAGGAQGAITIDRDNPVNPATLPDSLRLEIKSAGQSGRVALSNDGYWGIPVTPGARYTAFFYARADAAFTGPLTVSIESRDASSVFASAQVPNIGPAWKRYAVTLATPAGAPASADNRFVLSASSPGVIWLSLVSLFPATYNDRPNGLRIDLMQKLAALHPAFLRFPGGNYLEGNTVDERFDWKATLHGIDLRPGHPSCWGYPSTDGMGLLEFLEWCEDLKMQPLLCVYAGYSLHGQHISDPVQLAPFIQDALDEIEYVTGGPGTRWGRERAGDGHRAPFPLQYVEIGNEDWIDASHSYDSRFAQFADAIRAKYPALKLIATTPVRTRVPDLVDDHFYRSARDMEIDAHHYDNTPRNGPKIFVGEWATTEGNPTPNLGAALADAAWMTGMERNSDLVLLSSYAPLLVNVNPGASQWGTNLIGYNALTSFGSPSYYAQAMFSANRGDTLLPVDCDTTAAPNPGAWRGGIGVATWDTQAEFRDIQVTRGGDVLFQSDFADNDDGWRTNGDWSADNGILRQTGAGEGLLATIGNPEWTDYTITLKARKTGGQEGFLVLFHQRDDRNLVWWNVGGWGNTYTGFETMRDGVKAPLGQPSNFTVETGRWYDLRIELKGSAIRCFIDGKLISAANETGQGEPAPIYATASRVNATGEIILKAVNISDAGIDATINLRGVKTVAPMAKAIVLTSASPQDQNTIDDPEKIVPMEENITNAAPSFHHLLPAHSISILRLSAPAL